MASLSAHTVTPKLSLHGVLQNPELSMRMKLGKAQYSVTPQGQDPSHFLVWMSQRLGGGLYPTRKTLRP